MVRKSVIAILIVIAIGGGIWYYFSQFHYTQIGKILSNPMVYKEKVTTIEGEVTDRTSFFIVVKFFKLRDKTGELIITTKRTLPEVKSKVRVKGRVDEAFPIGDQKLLVFIAESVEEEGGRK